MMSEKSLQQYAEGYAEHWINCLGHFANLTGLSGQANDAYRALWSHWECELQPWKDAGDVSGNPPALDMKYYRNILAAK